jgi:photosystem II stability/assembly factor-like uncharacterized protein
VVFDPKDGTTVYAALGNPYGDGGNGVFKSTNAGQTWIKVIGLGTNVLSSTIMGRIGLAVDPSNPSNVYAAIAPPVAGGSGLPAIFKSADKGATWVELNNTLSCCSWYEDAIIVSPAQPNLLLTTGFSLLRSLDGGSTWADIGSGANGVALHPDQHAMAFSADGRRLYVANDGGGFSTRNASDFAVAWNDLNATIATITFYPGNSIHPTNNNLSFGGTQDNGSLRYTGGLPWEGVTCGDGFYTAVGPGSPAAVFTNCQNIGINKSNSNGAPGTFFTAQNGINTNDRSGWVSPLVMDPSTPSTLYFGTYRVYQTTDGANFWAAISPDLTRGGTIRTIAVAPTDSNTVYVASDDNRVSVTANAGAKTGATWADISTGLPLFNPITRITVDTVNPMTAYLAFGGFSGSLNPSLHVFKSMNGGWSWTDISGNLPDIPVSKVVVDPDRHDVLYIATDIGVFSSPNGGVNWHPLVRGLPRVVVTDLVLHRPSRTLRATTHGRSAWDLRLRP